MISSAVINVKVWPRINHAGGAEERDGFSQGVQGRVTELSIKN